MSKLFSVMLAVLLAFSLTACDTKTDTNNQDTAVSQVTAKEDLEKADFENAEFAVSDDGEILVEASPDSETSSFAGEAKEAEEKINDEDFTLPDEVKMEEDSLGILRIPRIGLEVSVYETDDEMEAMVNGVAHFKETSCWNGNIGLAGHNQGVNEFFGKLHKLVPGDTVKLETALGERNYKVVKSFEISETDWSVLDRSEENMITMITCVNHDHTKRLCVQAKEA